MVDTTHGGGIVGDLNPAASNWERPSAADDWEEIAAGLSCDEALRACREAGRNSFTKCLPAWKRCKQGFDTIFAPGI